MKRTSFSRLTVLALFLVHSFAASADENKVRARIRSLERLVPLEKITVGPDDQFNGDFIDDGRVLVYTEKTGLVTGIRLLDLTTGETTSLLLSNADAEDAVAGPGNRVAFTYYKFHARGDICFVQAPRPPFRGKTVKEGEIRCLKRKEGASSTQRSNPFWVSENVIGYLEREIDGRNARVVSENISSGEMKVLATGRIWSPYMRLGGRYLTYLEWGGEDSRTKAENRGRRIMIKDLQTGQTRVARFALPGFSGFPTISPNEEFLYFSHFFNDTNEDQMIDGADNGVVFRVPLEKIFAAGDAANRILPEQLTSVETSCGFPRVAKDRLLMTCAFEGSLDVYSTNASGIVPSDWDEKRILNAIDTSRSYQDRVLLLNALQYRFKGGFASEAHDERMLSEHILADDVSAARFYLGRLLKNAKGSDRAFYTQLGAYLEARELKKTQPPGEVSREFRAAISGFEKRILNAKGERRELYLAHLKLNLGEKAAAKSLLNRVNWRGKVRPVERYLHFELARALYRGKRGADFLALTQIYRTLLTAPDLNAQSRVFYAYNFLQDAHEVLPSATERKKIIEAMLKAKPGKEVISLLNAEMAVLDLISAADEKAEATAFSLLNKLLSETRNDYFLRRAFYTRAIVNFAEATKVKYLGVVARNWLRYTTREDTEFAYAREAFADNSLAQAYVHMERNNWLLADNYFYESLSFTDDLESHYGFIKSRLAQGRRADLLRDYEDLSRRKIVTDNIKFVEAVIDIFDDASDGQDRLDRAISKLEAMTDERDSGLRYLVLGYAYMEKLFRTAKGLDVNSEYLQNAHRSLMLAYDLAWDNPRIRASALMNLGILHQRVQNHGQAVRFFSLRKAFGFVSEEEKANFEYLYARSLAHVHQPDVAATELTLVAPRLRSVPHEERRAFYLAIASEYKDAASIYSRLLKEGQITGDANLAKAHLVYGYSLLKLGREAEAKENVSKALEFTSKLRPIKASKERFIDFDPLRIELIGYGLLARTGTTDERLAALRARLERLEKARDLLANWLEARIQTRTQIADFESRRGEHGRAAAELREALRLATEFGDSGQYLGKLTFRTASNFMAHAILHPEVYSKDDVEQIEAFVRKCIAAYEAQKVIEPVLDVQNLKLRILLDGMKAKILKTSGNPAEHLQAPVATRLRGERPDLFDQVSRLATALN